MELAQILSFTLVATLLVVSPGPNGFLIAKTVPTSGRSAGFANVGGFVAAFYLHGSLSILGISLILTQSAQAFFVVKMIGAAYLCWIGVKALWSAFSTSNVVSETDSDSGSEKVQGSPTEKQTLVVAFFEGFLTNALNPKVSMFYLAAFPQFISTEGAASSGFMLVTIHAVINLLWFASMVLLFAKLTAGAQNQTFQRLVKASTGIIFIGFGAKLATMRI